MSANTFLKYLLYRFQLVPLICLVASDILVIQRVTEFEHPGAAKLFAVFLFVMCYLFNNRVGDDKRDFAFDNAYYPERDLQQGLIKLKDLEVIGWVTTGLMMIAAMIMGAISMVLVIPVLLFALWAKNDFWLSNHFKDRHFFQYNMLNMMQMLVLQTFMYFSLLNSFQLSSLMWWHVAFIFTLSLQIEVTRKVKVLPTQGRDMYSDRLGMAGALVLWFVLAVVCAVLFVKIASELDQSVAHSLLFGAIFLLIQAVGALVYFMGKSEKLENLFWTAMIISYCGENLFLAYG